MNPLLTIIIPAFNEGAHLQDILSRLRKVEWPEGVEVEYILVNDGSTDHTGELMQQFQRENPPGSCTLLTHRVNQGKGAAIRTALPYVNGQYVVVQDGDNEYDPSDLATMLKCVMEKRMPALYGSRYLGRGRRDKSLYPMFYYGVRILSITANMLYRQHITDEATCYKMIDANLLKSMPLRCKGFEFCPEVTARLGRKHIRIEEIPIRYTPRSMEEGKKIRFKDGLLALWILIKYRLFL